MNNNTIFKPYTKPNKIGYLGWVEHKTMQTLIGYIRLDGSILRVEDIH